MPKTERLAYQSLLSSIPGSPANTKKINEYCSNVQFNDQMFVNVKEIRYTIHAMPIGKALCYDSASNEHFILFSCHCYVATC